jgi:peptidoglycan/xylan/chitin deacetylase (PgdA/CDA1 family)
MVGLRIKLFAIIKIPFHYLKNNYGEFAMKWIHWFLAVSIILFSNMIFAANSLHIPILCYHNLNPTVPGSMSLTPQKFESQIKWLKDNGFQIIPLQEAVEYLQGKRTTLPAKSVVITADDGWESVYTYMYPIVRKYQIPVTLFIYPGTISDGKHAMTWAQLSELQKTGLFDIQSHTYWHPNFKQAKKRMSPAQFDQYVNKELQNSKQTLEAKLNKKISYLAWPFGIYDKYLEDKAAEAGYVMAFTIDARKTHDNERAMAVPRYMVVDAYNMNGFAAIVSQPKS